MNTTTRVEQANHQLDRVLAFFGRLDAKHSVVLALDTGMLAFLASRAPALDRFTPPMTIASTLAVILIAVSYCFLYAGGKPTLKGGQQSVVYFREIAKRTEATYVETVSKITDEEYLRDILCQIWRNSEILAEKFTHLKSALLFLALSVLPWLASLVMFATLPSKTC